MPGRKKPLKQPKIWIRSENKPSDKALARLQKVTAEEEMASGGAKAKADPGEEVSMGNIRREINQMKTEVTSIMRDMLKEFASQMDKKIDSLAQNCKETDGKVEKIEGAVLKIGSELQASSGLVSQNETKIAKLEGELAVVQKQLIYIEDNSRRSNVKLINFSVKNRADLKKEVLIWMNSVMGTQCISESDLDRVHFLGFPRAGTRHVIVRFASYAIKEQFLAACRAKPDLLNYNSQPVQVYQDLSKSTIEFRKSVRPVTTVLARKGIKYSWGHPVFLRIWKGSVQHRISTVEEGVHLLEAWNIAEDDLATSPTPPAASTSLKP